MVEPRNTFLSSVLAVALVPLLVALPAWAQGGPVASAGALQIHLLDSDGSRVAANSRTTKGITVQVTDEKGTPVSDAAVAFRFPENGSSASFAEGSRSMVAYTDASGKAQIANFQWNDTPGAVAVRVTAAKANSHAGLLVEQQIIGSAAAVAPPSVHPVAVAQNEAEAAIPQEAEEPRLPTLKPGGQLATAGETPSEYVPHSTRLPRPGVAPMVSISNTEAGNKDMVYHGGISKKKWIMLGVLAGAGAGIAFAIMNGRSGAPSSTSGVSVGTPTISIGHP